MKEDRQEECGHKWTNTIKINTNNCRSALEVYGGYITGLQGHQEFTGDLIFDVKVGGNF